MPKNPILPSYSDKLFHTSPIHSSVQKGWNGIVVEHWQQEPRELNLPALSYHLITLALDNPHLLMQARDGRVYERHHLPGDINLMPAGQHSQWRWNKSNGCLHIHVEPQFLQAVAQETEIATRQIELASSFSVRDRHLEHIGMSLLAELKSEGLGGQLYVESLANILALHLLRHYSAFKHIAPEVTGGLSRYTLRQATEYILNHLDEDLALTDIAAAVHLSPSHFARLFKQSTGMTPHQYVIRCRVEEAKRLLSQGKSNIAQIASQVGFANHSHLTYHFKRLIGITPKTLRPNSKNLSK